MVISFADVWGCCGPEESVLIPWLAPHQLNGNVEYPPSLQNILRSWRQKFPWVLPSKAALSREWNNLDAN
ncbi:hypothetical protein Y032_0030g2195 [Ancylostoma ceylanicum]|uniref:Uncharacterized protein n=1 Tax=Ancylostoma ceylanicum TaxID=53326 RepID=A0A016US67_9BILA|nr:hypothetical protein Y032_0030g2195 [Ancylostoma ceylanicum]